MTFKTFHEYSFLQYKLTKLEIKFMNKKKNNSKINPS